MEMNLNGKIRTAAGSYFDDLQSNLPSELKFGLLFAGVFCLAGGYALYKSWPLHTAVALFVVAAVFLALAVLRPRVLRPLNLAWLALGMLLGKLTSPIVMGVIFFLIVTPVAFAMKLAGRDLLGLHKRNVQSYWIDRNPPGPAPDSFKNQF